MKREEEGVRFEVPDGVFYNPEMRFCRSFASLALGSIGEKNLSVCDAFTASGIRGLRYAKENKNVGKLMLLDIDRRAIASAKKNARANRLKVKCETLHGNISKLVFDFCADFLEIDPFGSPSPYLYDSFRPFNPLKRAYLSVTATDVAVLCGGKLKACMKNYHSVPMNNEFTHETGMRIMLKKIAETAAEFNMGIEPLASLSKRHYLKTIVKVTRGADLAHGSLMKLGFVNYCKSCGWRGSSRFPVSSCGSCRKTLDAGPGTSFAGPLWLGELHDRKTIAGMRALNGKREYADKAELEKYLGRMAGEIGMPPFYYDVHQMCRLAGCTSVPKMDAVLASLGKRGYAASRTHFSETSVKTDAPLKALKAVIA